ncbi:ATP-binding protein [Candidatus Obscuribacterales bacterium]|nr:ATP-binding protein [Candidatus Obscuribacterales bacterium]
MKRSLERKLAIYNTAVFAAVLIAFSSVLYLVVREGFYNDVRSHLERMTDGVISSIDYDREDHEEPLPDLIVSQLPASASESLADMRLQWFDKNQKLRIEKGALSVSMPLIIDGGFQTQDKPHAMLFTKAVIVNGALLGYARVAQPLSDLERAMNHLQFGLAISVVFASILSGLGITFLTSKSLQPVYQSIETLKQFTADASHELRTPVTAISANSGVALKYDEGMRESDREKFKMISSASSQMDHLVTALLQLSRLDNKLAEPRTAPQDVGKLLREVCDLTRWLAKEKDIHVVSSMAENLYVESEEDELRQVFQNLVENALRYTPNGGRVEISAERKNSVIEVSVSDTGIGISQDDLQKVFERFWRADKARSRQHGGSGLGLSITQAIVAKIGGSIDVQSKVDIGSTFTVRLRAAAIKTASGVPVA